MSQINKHFINPIKDGYLTSSFGWRNVNKYDGKGVVKDWHQGVDLSRQPNTNVEVLASADGEVYRVGTLGTYGKIVMIKHTVNGKRMDTVYAHLASYSVKAGDKVKQGQKIGIMGASGGNWAIHLHFELHDGAWATGQPNAVNPANYIKFYTKGEMSKMQEEIKKLQTMIKDLEKKLEEKLDKPKSSINPSTWAKEAWEWAKKKKDKKGNALTDGSNAQGFITREQMITILHRYDNSDK